jgi:hypothetical protein
MRRAIVLLDHTEDSLELARAHLFSAEVHLWGGNVASASQHLRQASRLESLGADARDLGTLHSCRALVDARRGEFERARRMIDRARDELVEAPAEQGVLWLAQGLSDAGRGDLDAAGVSLDRAVNALVASSMLREAVSVCDDWAKLLSVAGKNDEVADVEQRAAHLADLADAEAVRRRA